MNTNDLNTALYEKMAAEQDKYRDWLKSQPPEEILHHTYEYTVREDIVMAMEDLELTDAQAQALLDSPTPLADVYQMCIRDRNAGAEVVSDIIFLQKRDRPLDIVPEWTQTGQTEDGFAINRYFLDHPEMVLGRQEPESTAHGMDLSLIHISYSCISETDTSLSGMGYSSNACS